MNAWVRGFGWAVACGLVMLLVATTGCSKSEPKFPVTKGAGPMPADQTWTGVYYNPIYGNLHLVETGGNAVGRWKRTDASHWGELQGTVEGNLVRFTWKEHKIDVIGPSADTQGTGVFVYKVPANAEAAELDGQYALDNSDDVADWHCVKQNNVKPDLNSVNGKNPEGPAVHDAWQ